MEDFTPKKKPAVVNIETAQKKIEKERRLKKAKAQKDRKLAQEQKVEWYFNRGKETQDEGDDTAAEADYKEALKINPKYAPALANLGAIYWRSGKFKEAKDYFLDALKIDDDNALAWFSLGSVCENLNQSKEAMEYYQEAIQCDPNYSDPYFNLARLQTQIGENFAAISNYRNYLKFGNDEKDIAIAREQISFLTKLEKLINDNL